MENSKARTDLNIRKEQQAREGEKAWADYQAQGRAVRERTERLRALRLSKETAEPEAVAPVALTPVAPKPAKKRKRAKKDSQ